MSAGGGAPGCESSVFTLMKFLVPVPLQFCRARVLAKFALLRLECGKPRNRGARAQHREPGRQSRSDLDRAARSLISTTCADAFARLLTVLRPSPLLSPLPLLRIFCSAYVPSFHLITFTFSSAQLRASFASYIKLLPIIYAEDGTWQDYWRSIGYKISLPGIFLSSFIWKMECCNMSSYN